MKVLVLALVLVGCGRAARVELAPTTALEQILRDCDHSTHPYTTKWSACVGARATATRVTRPEATCAEARASHGGIDKSLSTCLAAHGRNEQACIDVATGSKAQCTTRLALCRDLSGAEWALCIDVGRRVGREVVDSCVARGGSADSAVCLEAESKIDGIGAPPGAKAVIIDACFARYAQMGRASPMACVEYVKEAVLMFILSNSDCYETKGSDRVAKGPECFAAARRRFAELAREPGDQPVCDDPTLLEIYPHGTCELKTTGMRHQSIATCLALDDRQARTDCLESDAIMSAYWWVMTPYTGPLEPLEQRCAKSPLERKRCVDRLRSVDGWELTAPEPQPEPPRPPDAIDPVIAAYCANQKLDRALCRSLDNASESGDARRLIEACRHDTQCLERARSTHHDPVAIVAACRSYSHDVPADFAECIGALGDKLPSVTIQQPGFNGGHR